MYQLEFPGLLLVLLLPIAVWWLLPPHRTTSASVRLPFFEQVTGVAGAERTHGAIVARRGVVRSVFEATAWGLIVAALARPQFVEPPVIKTEPQRDLMLALDLSQSMDAKDFALPDGTLQPRVDAVRRVVSDFVAKRPGDRIGLIAFGDAPYPLVPFTMDHATVQTVLSGTLPGIAGPRTALGDAVGLSIKMFEKTEVPEKVLIVLTDGNDTASRMPPAKAADIARRNGVVVHTVGIGDVKATGEDKLDTATLGRMAEVTGGRYFFAGDGAQLADIYGILDRITPSNQKTLSWRPRIELFQWPLGAAVILLASYYMGIRPVARFLRRQATS